MEVGFHDNPEEAQWIIDNTQAIAEAICKGLCRHYNAEYRAEEKTIYRVQVGAFLEKRNALRLRDDLISKGYEAFITQ